jgi:AcrR family transcriptional regulator
VIPARECRFLAARLGNKLRSSVTAHVVKGANFSIVAVNDKDRSIRKLQRPDHEASRFGDLGQVSDLQPRASKNRLALKLEILGLVVRSGRNRIRAQRRFFRVGRRVWLIELRAHRLLSRTLRLLSWSKIRHICRNFNSSDGTLLSSCIYGVNQARCNTDETQMTSNNTAQRRHKCFDDTHQEMIETAVSLISKKGIAAVSIASLARTMGINRTTVYYHFKSREELLDAVKAWSAAQLAKAFSLDAPQQERIDYITRFVLENPELIKLWIEDLIAVGDIRHRYPPWDALVKGIKANFQGTKEEFDAEVYSVTLLTSAIIGPRVFKNSVCPAADTETIVKRFRTERQRLLKHGALLRT